MEPDLHNKNEQFILAVCPNPSVDIFAWLDQLNYRKINRLAKEEHYPGGKGVHVALATAEMGEEVRLLGFWGGPTGNWIKQECEKRYPELSCIGPITRDWSRSCYTFKSDSEFDETELLGVGPTLGESELDSFFLAFEEAIVDAKCVTMSGSWPRNAGGDEYKKLLAIANSHNKASFLDCTGQQLTAALLARPFTVHLNRSEVTSHFGDENIQRVVQLLMDHCDRVAITDGAKGLYMCDKQKTIHALSKIDQVYSAVGSGDCLVAGLAVAYSRNLEMLETAKLGASCGAANCLRPELGLLNKQDVDQLYDHVEVEISNDPFVFV